MQPALSAFMRTASAGTALVLTAAAAHADLPDHMARAVKICLDDTPFAARVESLSAGGWTQITEAQGPEASLALAPYKMIFMLMYGFEGDWDPNHALDRLMRIADNDAAMLARPSDSAAVMVNTAGGTLEFSMYGPDSVSAACNLVAPGATETDIGNMLGVTLSAQSYPPPVRIYSIRSDEPSEPQNISFLTFTPYAFATHEPAPIIVILGPEEAAQ